jgi:hypothetical protein
MKKDTAAIGKKRQDKNLPVRRILRGWRNVTVNEKPIIGIHNHEIKMNRRDSI